MGSSQSVRATHFQNQEAVPQAPPDPDGEPEPCHISISNKMVERLVEDAALSGVAARTAAATSAPLVPRTNDRDMVLMEKLKSLDDSHSERTGLTVENVMATAKRIKMRTANTFNSEPVCAENAQRVIECYRSSERPQDVAKCWETINEYTKCVQEASSLRLRARTAKEAREAARRTRHVALAREHALRDLAPPPELVS